MKKCLIFDASNYMFRAYFASPHMTNSAGFPTNALHFYTSMILSVIHRVSPDVIALAHERRGPKFRHKLYPDYKGQRSAPPEDLVLQFPWFRRITDALGLQAYDADGFEADDVIATLTGQARKLGYSVVIATSDKDLMQLVERKDDVDSVVLLDALARGHKTEPKVVTVDDVMMRFQVDPGRVADVLALSGDTIDNIPGCKGIGEKTAGSLISEFGTLENLIACRNQIKRPAQRKNLDAFADDAVLSKKLVSLVSDVPVTLVESGMHPDPEAVTELFSALDLNKLLISVLGSAARLNPEIPKITAAADSQSACDSQDEAPEEDEDGDENGRNMIMPRAALAVPERTPQKVREFVKTDVLCDAAAFKSFIDESASADRPVAVMPLFSRTSPASPAVFGLAAASEKRSVYLPSTRVQRSLFDTAGTDTSASPEKILDILSNPKLKCIVFGIKPLIQWAKANHREIDISRYFDAELAAYVIHPERTRLSIESCAEEYLAEILELTPENWLGSGRKKMTPESLSHEQVADTAGRWAQVVLQLGEILPHELDVSGVRTVYGELDFPIAEVLAEMEFNGIALDIESMHHLSDAFDETIKRLDAEAHSFGDEPFNINSPKSLGHFMYETLELVPATRKRRQHGLSTDQDTLESIDHPLARIVLEYRTVSKLRSTYAEALADLADPVTSRIHGHFNECVTATTRLSSSDPNLQNIPGRTELGREIKRRFVPRPGWTFISADYSQIELRLMAAFSKEPVLCNAYHNGEDVHARTAAALHNIDIADVTKAQRQLAKTINFGLIYGMGVQKLARETGISKQEAKEFLEKFHAQFPCLMGWLDNNLKQAYKNGEIRTVFGHRRPLPELYSERSMIRAAGERIANNAPIQGSASDIVKRAMIRLTERIKREKLSARLLVQIHDELLLECPDDEVEATSEVLVDAMENAADIGVPLKVELKTGKNWADMN